MSLESQHPPFDKGFFTPQNRIACLEARPGANAKNRLGLKPGQRRLLETSFITVDELTERQNTRWSTGTELDDLLDGGFPPGINMIYGEIASDGTTTCGKTLLATYAAQEALNAGRSVIWVSPDNNTDWVPFIQVPNDNDTELIVVNSPTFEATGYLLQKLAEKHPDVLDHALVVIDSVDGLERERNFGGKDPYNPDYNPRTGKVIYPYGGSAEYDYYHVTEGERGVTQSAFFRQLEPFLHRHHACAITVHQTRARARFNHEKNEDDFYYSLTGPKNLRSLAKTIIQLQFSGLRFRTLSWQNKEKWVPPGDSLYDEEVSGIRMRARVEKAKCQTSARSGKITLRYPQGSAPEMAALALPAWAHPIGSNGYR